MVLPDNPAALARGINEVLAGAKGVENRVAEASRRVQEHSWDSRAKTILDSVSSALDA